MGEPFPVPSFDHILAAVGTKSYLWGGHIENFDDPKTREEVASVLSVFDHEMKQWERRTINTDQKPPGMRPGGFVAQDNFIYSFGGRHDATKERYNILHKFDTAELRWIAFPPCINLPEEAPLPKAGCEPVIIDGNLCLFGGCGVRSHVQRGSTFHDVDSEKGHTNEFHLYNLTDAVPHWMAGHVTGDRPPPCSYHTLTLVDSKRAVLFGGNTATGRTNDVYIMTLDGIDATFQKIEKYGPWPEKRSSHAACVLNYDQKFPQLLVAGGLDEKSRALGDLWLFSVDHGMWIKISENEVKRWRPTLSCVSLQEKRASVLMFGGINDDSWTVSLTTILEFNLIENSGAVLEWKMENKTIPCFEDKPPDQTPTQATDHDESPHFVNTHSIYQ